MHETGSFILTVIERVRAYLDDVDLSSKYGDDFIVRHLMQPCLQDVIARVALMRSDPVLMRLAVSLLPGVEYYQLPPCVHSVRRLAMMGDDGTVLWEEVPRSEYHPGGPRWAIEGNLLAVRPVPSSPGQTLSLWYVSNGDHPLHYATGNSAATGGSVASGQTTEFRLAQTVGYGAKDRRVNAYAGSVLRILGANTIWQERIISSSHPTTNTHGTLEVRVPFDPPLAGASSIRYEIAPPLSQSLWEAVACATAVKMATYKGLASTRRAAIIEEYKKAMKTVKDAAAARQGRVGSYFAKDTIDNLNNDAMADEWIA